MRRGVSAGRKPAGSWARSSGAVVDTQCRESNDPEAPRSRPAHLLESGSPGRALAVWPGAQWFRATSFAPSRRRGRRRYRRRRRSGLGSESCVARRGARIHGSREAAKAVEGIRPDHGLADTCRGSGQPSEEPPVPPTPVSWPLRTAPTRRPPPPRPPTALVAVGCAAARPSASTAPGPCSSLRGRLR